MPLPAEVGIQQQDQRPYGAGVREQMAEQDKRAAEMTEPPARPMRPKPPVPAPGAAPVPLDPNTPKNPGPPMDTGQEDPRDESLRAIRAREAGVGFGSGGPRGHSPVSEEFEYRVSDASRRLAGLPLLGGLYSTIIGNPVRTLQMLGDALLFQPHEQVVEEDKALDEYRDALIASGVQEWWRDDGYIEASSEVTLRRVIAGATGDLGNVGRLTRGTAVEVSRLSSIAQRLRAIGLEKDARAVENEISLTSGAQPEGLATREHLDALEDIVSTKQTSGYYGTRAGEQAGDIQRLKTMREGVTKREADAAKAAESSDTGASSSRRTDGPKPSDGGSTPPASVKGQMPSEVRHVSDLPDMPSGDGSRYRGTSLREFEDIQRLGGVSARKFPVDAAEPPTTVRGGLSRTHTTTNPEQAFDYSRNRALSRDYKYGQSSKRPESENTAVVEFDIDGAFVRGWEVDSKGNVVREVSATGGFGAPPAVGGSPNASRGVSETPGAMPNLGINMVKIDAPQHVKDLIESEARAHIGDITAQRRGVQPLQVTFAKARNLGIDVPQLGQIPAGTAFNAEGAVAIFNAIVKTAEKRSGLEQTIRDAGPLATPEMEARWLASVYDQNTLQRIFAGGRAELGRGLNVLKQLSSGVNSGQIKDTFTRALDAVGGRRNFDKLLKRMRDIQLDPTLDPYQREIAQYKLVGAIDKAGFWDKINDVFYNSILSNPLTWTANALGQTALYEAEVLSQFPAAMFDALASGGGKIRPRERTLQGAIVQAVAGHAAIRRATAEALLYARTGVAREEVEKFRESGAFRRGPALESGPGPLTRALRAKGVPIPDVPGAGEIGTIPTHILATTDTFFYAVGYQRQLYQDAANFVARDGKDSVFGRGFWTRVADITSHPDDFLMDGRPMSSRAEEAGRRAGLRQDAGDFQKALQEVVHWEIPKTGGLRPGIFIAPFVRIGFNLARVGAEYSPLGFLRVAGTRGGEQADAFGRATLGSALWWTFWQKADAGEITGPVPSDPQAQKQFYDDGKKPYAIRVGDHWVEFGRYEPIATTLKWVWGMNKIYREVASQPPDAGLYGSALLKSIGVMTNALVDSSYLSGINDVYDLASANDANFERKALRLAGNTLNAVIPYSGLRRFASQRTDDLFRAPEGIGEQIMASTPGLSTLVKPYLTHWGEPSTRPDLVWGLSASQDRRDKVDEALAEVVTGSTLDIDGTEVPRDRGIIVGLVQQDIDGLKLTPDEGFLLQQVAGRSIHDALAALFEGDTQVTTESGKKKHYDEMDARERGQAVRSTISTGRRVARATVADAILLDAKDDGAVKRAASMRLATIPKVSDRAAFLFGLSKQGRLSAEVRRYLNEHRDKGERTVEQYLQLAQGR